ncbi:MAG: sterol desaturase family protein [Cyclobacteriaceae bacterium]
MKKKNKNLIFRLYDLKGFPMVVLAVGALFLLEKKFPLRGRKMPRMQRAITNAQLIPLASMSLRFALVPGMVKAASLSEKYRFGISRWLGLKPLPSAILSFLILDYGNYLWHRLTHRIGWLWRFHQVHHADLDMDVSTALRFHVGEMVPSVIYRGAWAALAGASPRAVLIYEIFFELANNFHHSNLHLPSGIEKILSRIIVTPRIHGIHHSIVREETDSNFTIVFTAWDQLHRTFKADIPQEEINIGVPYVRKHLQVMDLMKMPFDKEAKWELPDGTVPQRVPLNQSKSAIE